jgi:hypothetical protein
VKSYITIRRLLSILMIAGLALAPLSRKVMAEMSSDVSMTAMPDDMSTVAPSDELASDMPCCPSKAAAPIGCDKCVFMAACMTKCFAGISAAAFQPLLTVSGTLGRPQNDLWPDSRGHPPPDQPPRISI